MRRLTKKQSEKWYTFLHEAELDGSSIDVVNKIVNNWGKVEEKYNIKNLKELEEILYLHEKELNLTLNKEDK